MTHPIAQKRFEGPQFLSGEPQEKQHKIILYFLKDNFTVVHNINKFFKHLNQIY